MFSKNSSYVQKKTMVTDSNSDPVVCVLLLVFNTSLMVAGCLNEAGADSLQFSNSLYNVHQVNI